MKQGWGLLASVEPGPYAIDAVIQSLKDKSIWDLRNVRHTGAVDGVAGVQAGDTVMSFISVNLAPARIIESASDSADFCTEIIMKYGKKKLKDTFLGALIVEPGFPAAGEFSGSSTILVIMQGPLCLSGTAIYPTSPHAMFPPGYTGPEPWQEIR